MQGGNGTFLAEIPARVGRWKRNPSFLFGPNASWPVQFKLRSTGVYKDREQRENGRNRLFLTASYSERAAHRLKRAWGGAGACVLAVRPTKTSAPYGTRHAVFPHALRLWWYVYVPVKLSYLQLHRLHVNIAACYPHRAPSDARLFADFSIDSFLALCLAGDAPAISARPHAETLAGCGGGGFWWRGHNATRLAPSLLMDRWMRSRRSRAGSRKWRWHICWVQIDIAGFSFVIKKQRWKQVAEIWCIIKIVIW